MSPPSIISNILLANYQDRGESAYKNISADDALVHAKILNFITLETINPEVLNKVKVSL